MQALAQFPTPNSTAEIELLFDVARSIPYFSQMTAYEQDDLIRRLQAYECYTQAVTLLNWRMENSTRGEIQKLDDYVAVMRIWHDGCEDFVKFIEVAKDCIQRLRLSFATIRVRIIDNIIGAENFEEQVKVYRAVAASVDDIRQRVLLLERLAFLFEKKLTLNVEVESTFQEVLTLDPTNTKALRYFKVLAVQSGHWRDATKYLEKMMEAFDEGSFERTRAAFELAQIVLYHLNQAPRAREILAMVANDPRIDTTQTFCEALERSSAFDELLDFLDVKEHDAPVRDDKSRIKHKMGLISLKAGKQSEAIQFLQESVALNPRNLMAHESLVSTLLEEKMNKELIQELRTLANNVKLDSSAHVLHQLIERASLVF